MSALLATEFLPILYNYILKICPWGQLLLFWSKLLLISNISEVELVFEDFKKIIITSRHRFLFAK